MKHKSEMKHEKKESKKEIKKEDRKEEKKEGHAHHMKMAHHHMKEAVKAAKAKHKK